MSKLTLSSLERHRDLGLLVARVGIGLFFVFVHGWPKLAGGPEAWTKLGGALGRLGIDLGHSWFGLFAALAETAGGALIALGFLTRWSCLALIATMAMASFVHLDEGDPIGVASHAMKMGLFFIGLLFVGPGRYSVDARLR